MIRVDGSDLASVETGQTVEIGRKPLRPVPSGGMRRIEILDDTRSMSKRHAEFSVKSDGNAILRDLNSTNGTFLVRPGNELVRLPGGSDFALNDDTVRLQFGDVPVDFVRFIDDDTTSKDDDVANLFDYALDNQPSEPEVADMSIDDILNLRAGEPTDIFNAGQVRSRAKELRQSEQQTFVPFSSPLNPLAVNDANDDDAQDAAPRDLFADAHDVAAGKIDEPAAKKEEFVPRMHDGPRHADRRNADSLVSVSELAQQHRPIPSLSIPTSEPVIGATREPVSPTVSPTNSANGEPSISTTIRPQSESDNAQPDYTQSASPQQQPSVWQTSMRAGVAMQPQQPIVQQSAQPMQPTAQPVQSAQPMQPVQQPAQPVAQQMPDPAQPTQLVDASHIAVQQPMMQPQNVQTSASQVPLVNVAIPTEPTPEQQPTSSDAFTAQRNALHFDVIESALQGADNAATFDNASTTENPTTPDNFATTGNPSAADATVPIEVAAPAHQTNFVAEAIATTDAAMPVNTATPANTTVPTNTAAPTTATTPADDAYDRFRRHDDDAQPLDETQTFTPAFEPGSVFERVANGDFDKPKELIEVDGYTSDDARRSDDFTEQFEMARHAELLPFLAMNPTLYDDLYEWLAAQSNADIDEALSRNPGYEDYRKAVGK
ncbi:FHA domain-containing protein [uncultured Bifidobacterium sp.]|uniref:FHA domain-containing protein n=1 Tax=uncultured Bifidobacterium sp. TaxID=165187 RepID=UPI0025950E10|nr:FHA domain-containing protein [uncultured Bifidobacterium sp.]